MTPIPDAEHRPPAAASRTAWRRWLCPPLNRWFLPRLLLVGGLTYLFFGQLCLPTRIHGRSMEPTYRDGRIAFCWRPRYWVHPPRRGSLVMIRLAGRRVMLFKRVIAVAGDTVEFRAGQLWLNGQPQPEPYAAGPCDWELPLRTVPAGHVYVVGDNRTMAMDEHHFGSVARSQIEGGPVW